MLLNFEANPQKSKSSQVRLKALGVILVVLVAFVGFKTTLASNISLNSGTAIEYGQGISQATACSGGNNITVTPSDSFTNSSGSGAFYFNSFTVTGVPSGCSGDDLVINAFDDSTNTPFPLFNSTNTTATIWDNAGTFTVGASMTGAAVTSLSTSSFRVTFTVPVQSSNTIYKLGIQSGGHTPSTCAQGATCAIGDTGPGGGTVYYVNSAGFTEAGSPCGSNCHYLEWAPDRWYQNQTYPTFYWASDQTHQALASDNTTNDYTGNKAIGSGFANTAAMLTPSGSYTADTAQAASAAHAYTGTDSSAGSWFVPSAAEMYAIWTSGTYTSAYGGNFQPYIFWTSSEYSASTGWEVGPSNGFINYTQKTNSLNLRPVRAF